MIKMKICIVAPTFFPLIGGTEVAIYEIATRLIKHGHKIIIVTRRLEDTKTVENIKGIDVYRVFAPDKPLGILPLQCSLSNKLRDIIGTCTLIHQFHLFHMGLATVLIKKMFRKPLVLSLMGCDTYDPHHPIPKALNPYLAWVMNSSDVITSPSRDLANHAREQGCKKSIEIIPHGVNVNKFNPNVDGSEIRKKLGVKNDELMILSVQRLHLRKKLEYLTSAIRKVVKEKSNIKFVITGKGLEKKRLETLVKNLDLSTNVIFTGFVAGNQLPTYYAACDIFVLHTTYEAFGIVLVEAMASGKPIVSTRVGGIPEIVENGRTGLLIPPMNSEMLAEAILKLADNEKLRKKMGRNGREKAVKKFDWNVIVEKWLSTYEKIIG